MNARSLVRQSNDDLKEWAGLTIATTVAFFLTAVATGSIDKTPYAAFIGFVTALPLYCYCCILLSRNVPHQTAQKWTPVIGLTIFCIYLALSAAICRMVG